MSALAEDSAAPGPFTEAEAAVVYGLLGAAELEPAVPLDLEALVTSVQGVLDPIGQLAGWLADQLRSLSSWLASAVESVVSRAYSAVIRPVLDGISSAVRTASTLISSIWDTVRALPTQLSGAISAITSALSGVRDFVASGVDRVLGSLSAVASAVASHVRGILDALSRAAEALHRALASGIEGLARALSSVASAIASQISGIADAVSRAVGAIGERLASAVDGVLRSVAALSSALASWAREVLAALSRFGEAVRSTVASAVEGLSRSLSAIGSAITSALREAVAAIARSVEGLASALGSVAERLIRGVAELGAAIASWFRDLLSAVWRAMEALGSMVRSGVEALAGAVRDAFSAVASWLRELTASIGRAVHSIVEAIGSGIGAVVGFLRDLVSGVASWFGGVYDAIAKAIETVVSAVRSAFDAVRDALGSLVHQVGQLIAALPNVGSAIVGAVQWAFGEVAKLLGGVWNGIVAGFEGIRAAVWSAFAAVSEVFKGLIDSLREFASYVRAFGAQVLGGLASIGEFIMRLPETIGKGLHDLFAPIFEGLTKGLEALGGTVRGFVDSLLGFLANPWEAIRKGVVEPFLGGAGWLWDRLRDLSGLVFQGVAAAGGWIWDRFKELWKIISAVLKTLVSWTVSVAKGIASELSAVFAPIGEWMSELLQVQRPEAMRLLAPIAPVYSGMLRELRIGSPQYLTVENFLSAMFLGTGISTLLFAFTALMGLAARFAAYSVRYFGAALRDLIGNIELQLGVLGTGARVAFNVTRAIGATLWNLGGELQKVSEKWGDYSAMGMLFWYGRTVSRLVTYHLRNFVPIAIPALSTVAESLRRGYVADRFPGAIGRSFEELHDIARYYLAVRGFSDAFVSLVTAGEEEFFLTVRDRFEATRRIPLSLRFTLPPPSDVVKWLIRDVVVPPVVRKEDIERNIAKLLGMRGLPSDVAKLYYIANFRYPSPASLARFYWRGVTKVLWLPDSLEEREIAEAVGARYRAVPPRELNRNVRLVNEAISRYWRWHDLAPFTWFPGFTTDKAIVLELTAGLPGRLLLRWMTRWGIFEHLAAIMRAAGLPPDAPLPDILARVPASTGKELFSPRVTPEIQFDVRLLARMLEATGLHPDFVPLTAVAQAHQALTEEMTLTRTGFLNAFREGLVTLDASEQLMSGLFVVRFYTGYMDPPTGEWRELVYNKPVLWLPAERRLLQIRSVFDRYVDLWRDFVREVVAGVRRVAIYPEEAAELLGSYFSRIRERWGEDIKAISGVDWAPVLDQRYVDLWLYYSEVTRIIETRVWIRNYTARLMGWLMYRVGYGWLTEADYSELLSAFERNRWITAEESRFFRTVFGWLVGVVRREYIPTPLTLATFAEYMAVPEDAVRAVFDELRVPERFRHLYAEYIRVRPLKPDFRALLGAYRRALVRGAVTEDAWKRLLEEAKRYGFSDAELSIIQRVADVEEMLGRAGEYVPTLAQLVSFAEYVGLPEELVDRVLELRGVGEPWRGLWKQLIRARTVADDARVLLSSYYRVLRAGGTVPDELRAAVERYLQAAGLTKEEVAVRDLAAQLDAMVETLPTLSALAAMAEYVEVPPEYLARVMALRRVERTYAELWTRYVQRRTVAAELSRVVAVFASVYERFAVPEELVRRVEAAMAQGGWTPRELELWRLELSLRRQYRELVALVPGVRQAVSDGLYMPRYEALLEDVFRTYGLAVERYRAQLDYYRRLLKNRRLWRHFSWWRSRLMNAYAYGVITLDHAKARLQKFKELGLVDDDEIALVLDGLELQRMYVQRPRPGRG